MDAERNDLVDLNWQELIVYDDAAIVHVSVRVGKLTRYNVSTSASFVHQKRCIHVAQSTRMLVAVIELTKTRSFREESSDSVLQLAS